MASDIPVLPECEQMYKELQANEFQYIIYKIDMPNSEFIVDEPSRNKNWNEFVYNLPEDEPRLIVYNFQFERDGVARTKIIFINWVPKPAPMEYKKVQGAAKGTLKQSLKVVGPEIQAEWPSELIYETVLERVAR
ncbi:actin depolymerizing factor [Fusarium sporotrichioides]|uniref:Cofilin n=1 Tax=Fusarium sporotrichioides TaxID=5514 RepID=A0A395RWZ0_FUSSP|nr:actin depolymerizing factor [Fusarium sporotrichioides]